MGGQQGNCRKRKDEDVNRRPADVVGEYVAYHTILEQNDDEEHRKGESNELTDVGAKHGISENGLNTIHRNPTLERTHNAHYNLHRLATEHVA